MKAAAIMVNWFERELKATDAYLSLYEHTPFYHDFVWKNTFLKLTVSRLLLM